MKNRTETKLQKIMDRLKTIEGTEAKRTTYGATYHDGTEHTETAPAVFISADYIRNPAAYRQAVKTIKAARMAIYTEYHPRGTHSNIIVAMTPDDATRIKDATRKAGMFSQAWEQEQHRQRVSGEPDDIAKMIQAGHAALKAAGYMDEAEEEQQADSTPAA